MTRRLAVLIAALALFAFFAGAAAFAQDPAPAAEPPPAPAETSKSLLDVYNEGGFMMHILLACSIGMIACIAYCFVRISPGKMMPKGQHESLVRYMKKQEVTDAYQLCLDQPNTYANVVSAALLKVNFERDLANKLSMEQAALDALDQEETKQMLWVNYLNVFATIAPMIGLLGTVWGMIEAFDVLAHKQGDPGEIAGGIGTAMSTTAGGLIVGIPSMFFYFFFRNRLMAITADIQRNATFLLDIVSGEVKLGD